MTHISISSQSFPSPYLYPTNAQATFLLLYLSLQQVLSAFLSKFIPGAEETRWWSRRTLSSPPLRSTTPKSQLTAKQPLIKKKKKEKKTAKRSLRKIHCLSCPVRLQRQDTRKWSFTGNGSHWHLDLGFWSLQNPGKSICVVYKTCNEWCFCYSSLIRLR